ncbi:MAG: cytochrome c3 family protein [Thermoleophilia bacterium]
MARHGAGESGRVLLVVLVAVFLAAAAVIVAGMLLLAPWSRSEDSATNTTATSLSPQAPKGLTSVTATDAGDTSGAPKQIEGEPFRTCESCHPDFLSKPDQTAANDLIFSHQTHLDNDVQCVTCHTPPLGHFDSPAPMMMACLQCHQGDTAPHECSKCHRKIDEIAPGLSDPVVHLDPDIFTRQSCEKCHDVDTWCEQCHGVEMPHPAGWQTAHTTVAVTGGDTCVKCHQSRDKTFCVRCHGVEMPHPPYWYSSHGDVARSNGDTCARCHPAAPQFCNQCHHAGFSPTQQWAAGQHGTVVGQRGTAACFVCHDQTFCERCHDKEAFLKQ